MKAICAINHPASGPNYLEYTKVCVKTARDCGFEPWLLCDGDGIDDLFDCPMLHCQSRFLPLMQKHLRPDELAIARGAMLRLEIPRLFEDETVLYTDVDVMFRRPAVVPQVRYWGMVHEFDRNSNFNSGVSAMNLPALRATAEVFGVFCGHIIAAGRLPSVCWDQGLINLFYYGLIDRLPDEWNWRPYWGANDSAIVLHFHGPKPLDTTERIERDYPRDLWPPQFFAERERWLSLHQAP